MKWLELTCFFNYYNTNTTKHFTINAIIFNIVFIKYIYIYIIKINDMKWNK